MGYVAAFVIFCFACTHLGTLSEARSVLASGPTAPSCVSYRWVYANPRFVHKDDDAPIPATALDYTHMGMLATLPNGQLAAAWQGATEFWEGSIKQGISLSASTDGGTTWTTANTIVRPTLTPVWAPVLHVEGSRTYMIYAESRPQCWSWGEGGLHWACGGDIKLTWSDNDGAFWVPPKIIYSYDAEGGIGKMVANKLAIGPSGEWLLPFWREQGGDGCMKSPKLHGKAGVLISEDKGVSWRKSEVSLDEGLPSTWLIEAAISEYRIGAKRGYLQFFRTEVKSVYMTKSDDGLSWQPAGPINLPNPNSKVDSATLKDGSILLAYNNNATSRTALTLARSKDGGSTWQNLVVLENDPKGSFSYPTILYDQYKDEAKIIYSVAYPKGITPSYPNGLDARNSLGEELSWNSVSKLWSHVRSWFGRSPKKQTAVQPLKGAENAWGLDAFGLRLATVSDVLSRTAHPCT